MADGEGNANVQVEDEDPEETPGYVAPAQKSLKEIQELDADDESLVRYKQQLLAGAANLPVSGDVKNVSVEKLVFMVEGRNDVVLDLTGDLSVLKEKPIAIKEGAEYRLKIIFKVNREIVSGLRYHNVFTRKGIRVDKQTYMVGSYGPNTEAHSFTAPPDEAPKGMMARGSYKVKSKFIDDDKIVHLEWDWAFDIKKDWE